MQDPVKLVLEDIWQMPRLGPKDILPLSRIGSAA